MSEPLTRRETIRNLALALTSVGLGALDLPAATAVHHAVRRQRQEAGSYEPQGFTLHEYATLRRLCELILPADERSGSALDAGAPEFIDLLASHGPELARIFTSGILWLDHETGRRYSSPFLEADSGQQTEILDLLVEAGGASDPGYESWEESEEYGGFQDYTTEPASPLAPGVRFFAWVRRLTVDAFYTSPEGIRDVDYRGNRFVRQYRVPEDAIRYALGRSPFATE